MSTYLINYASGAEKYIQRQQIQVETAQEVGGFDHILTFDETILSSEFRAANSDILEYQNGAGLWIWKPYLVKHVLENVASEGDVVFYVDADHRFDKSPTRIFEKFDAREGKDRDIFLFHEWGDQAWNCTYPCTFKAMGVEHESFYRLTMLLAGYHLWRAGDQSIDFVTKWLEWCCNPDALLPVGPCPEIKAHCFDQSILTLLAAIEGVTADVSPKSTGHIAEAYRGER